MSVAKEGRESPHKINLLVCLIVARHLRRLALAPRALTKRVRQHGGSFMSSTRSHTYW